MESALVLRFSSMGDVLLTLPVLKGVLAENEQLTIILVTRSQFIPYFSSIDRLIAVPFDPRGRHDGITGLVRLYREISNINRIGKVIDLHGVLRTYVLGLMFRLTGRRIYRIKKYRHSKYRIIRRREQLRLPHTSVRYAAVFSKAGFRAGIVPWPLREQALSGTLPSLDESMIQIGFAPFSKHPAKNWIPEHSRELLHRLTVDMNAMVHLFGGKEDQELLEELSGRNIVNESGRQDAAGELSLMVRMKLMISMDSANMHLAALTGIPVISIWGGTHPDLGFAPLNQPFDHIFGAPVGVVPCRPCSVYGKKNCHLIEDPMRCMRMVSPESVYRKISEILNN